MLNIATKKIARRQPWTALALIGMVEHTLDKVKWLVGIGDQPGYEDRRTGLPPVQLSEQLRLLRDMAAEMEGLTTQSEESLALVGCLG